MTLPCECCCECVVCNASPACTFSTEAGTWTTAGGWWEATSADAIALSPQEFCGTAGIFVEVDINQDGAPSIGETMRVLVDYVDDDNYYCVEFELISPVWCTSNSSEFVVRLIERVAGVDSIIREAWAEGAFNQTVSLYLGAAGVYVTYGATFVLVDRDKTSYTSPVWGIAACVDAVCSSSQWEASPVRAKNSSDTCEPRPTCTDCEDNPIPPSLKVTLDFTGRAAAWQDFNGEYTLDEGLYSAFAASLGVLPCSWSYIGASPGDGVFVELSVSFDDSPDHILVDFRVYDGFGNVVRSEFWDFEPSDTFPMDCAAIDETSVVDHAPAGSSTVTIELP